LFVPIKQISLQKSDSKLIALAETGFRATPAFLRI
jgi:hypothetical protein